MSTIRAQIEMARTRTFSAIPLLASLVGHFGMSAQEGRLDS
jgi:hypothetical protein